MEVEQQELQIGNVLFFNEARGYGFLADAEEQSHYFHIKFVEHLANGARPIPKPGDLFYFRLRPSTSKSGADEAFGLRLARRAQAAKPQAEAE
jgi:hypothetical protein